MSDQIDYEQCLNVLSRHFVCRYSFLLSHVTLRALPTRKLRGSVNVGSYATRNTHDRSFRSSIRMVGRGEIYLYMEQQSLRRPRRS